MTPKAGRPRTFDPDQVLTRATDLFWRYGYDATSISALTASLGITSSSLYASFGDKKQLFTAVVERYQKDGQRRFEEAFDNASSAREGIRAYLEALAEAYTDPAHPPGCLVTVAAVNCPPSSTDVERYLRDLREVSKQALITRIDEDIEKSLMPVEPTARQLGTYFAALIQGMSTQARDGATRSELQSIVEIGMRAIS